ncbi:hypothetical protein [Streptomyces sp. NPDC059071]|uniref:hypothetical protein n=1 Tax=Streptomyces sp. NPDC059071 TaxID=3346714 RepID=UPI0036C521B0
MPEAEPRFRTQARAQARPEDPAEAEPGFVPAVDVGHEPTQVVPQLVQDALRGPGTGPWAGAAEGPDATRVVTEPPAQERADTQANAGAEAEAEARVEEEAPEPDGPGEGR